MLMRTITKSEYARRKGVTPGAVCNAIRRGKITPTDEGRIDPQVADLEWELNRQRQPPIKAAPVRSLPANPPLDSNERLMDHLAVWICWRFPSSESNLLETLKDWLFPIPDRAGLAVELENMLCVFGENLDRRTRPKTDERKP